MYFTSLYPALDTASLLTESRAMQGRSRPLGSPLLCQGPQARAVQRVTSPMVQSLLSCWQAGPNLPTVGIVDSRALAKITIFRTSRVQNPVKSWILAEALWHQKHH
ncbi:PREDICTED: oocyte-expressed protein homolog [Chrysochloris asiatica]|uniref:Oocyte-expressed protein homolog n=1 Tax=Chrysochloris asiatica TaxID=185453 RepID=A0A9B0WV08_CHRAS|nr:PREDICTED: oocyte-expressed protein homolog [Chrysochloris asiatica]